MNEPRIRVPRRARTVLAAVAAATVGFVLLVVLLFAQHRSHPQTRATPFAPDSVWNARLGPDVKLSADSGSLVSELQRQVTAYGTWINTYSYSTPVYTVPAGQPGVPVTLDAAKSTSQARLAAVFGAGVPIPSQARPAPGTDGDMVIWQPSTDTIWELWIARLVSGRWHASWGGRMDRVSSNPGYFTNPPDWGTAATSLALLGGTARIAELQRGRIDHALAISIPEARSGVFAYPAQRTDGKLSLPNAIPEGTRFRLDPKLNLRALGLPPMTRMLAEAAQRYGLILRDQGGVVSFYGEQDTHAPDAYFRPGGLYGGISPDHLTKAFPWSHLQVVAAPLHTG